MAYRIEDLKAAWIAGEKYKFLYFRGRQPPPEGGVWLCEAVPPRYLLEPLAQ